MPTYFDSPPEVTPEAVEPEPAVVPEPAPAPQVPEEAAPEAPTVVSRVSVLPTSVYVSELGRWIEPGEDFESSLVLSDAMFPRVKE